MASETKLMKIFQYTIFPSCVIGTFKIIKTGTAWCLITKAHKVVNFATFSTKSSLYNNNEVVRFQEPFKYVAHHIFKCFTAGKSYALLFLKKRKWVKKPECQSCWELFFFPWEFLLESRYWQDDFPGAGAKTVT